MHVWLKATRAVSAKLVTTP